MSALARGIATMGGIGFAPKASGTVASAVAILPAWLLHWAGGFPLFLVATVLAIAGGWWATARYVAAQPHDADPSEVVIDELAGQWIALLPLSWGLWAAGTAAHVFPYPGWIAGFVLFRLFDIWKPGPVGWAERRHGAFGIMADDVVAGVIAAVLVTVMAGVAHGGFG